ncbi:MAG: LON peptidase substrate-binding domain-containing protein [Gammaproteobacteria bacterium]|nr:LON peptidase substrate-binding domain-containing protein [Gammaproteobacteria bacterium]MDH3446911.1 LON peptidase substrate-binding domain-containing protein [Gammaproteobacteria bacterium]
MPEIPLFPLKSVLLPGNTMALKIFEPRYLDMIANCMREDSGFGVVLIHRGEETATDTDIYSIGTTATIGDWEHRADGLLGITAVGTRRFEILSTRTQQDGLTFAEVKLLEESHTVEIPGQFHYMLQLLDHISAQAGRIRNPDQPFSEILYQLIYLLPLETALKQRLLEIPECNDRAIILHAELIRLGVIQYVKPDEAG